MDSVFTDNTVWENPDVPYLPKNCQMNLVRLVDLIRAVGTVADKVGKGRHQERKALRVGEMPVEDVLL